ncbi:MAG: hypothetical protein RMK29_15530 [Myxococcales bacterium]|nr:hypothetical protein [Myxococcales bacterium]
MPDASSTIVGVDFGAPQRARDQRRKIIAIAAHATDWRRYRIDATGMNARLLANDPPGWTAKELLDELLTRPARIAAFDFPFCVPEALLRDEKFAADAGHKGAFIGWRSFNWHIAQTLPLGDPLDFRPFDAWRSRADRARLWTKRVTDVIAGGQPPLKDKFQATFQMTLLGNVLLSKLRESHKYRVLPFPGGRGAGEVIEVYPGATLRQMGLANYKSRPEGAIRLGIAACLAAGIKIDQKEPPARLFRPGSPTGAPARQPRPTPDPAHRVRHAPTWAPRWRSSPGTAGDGPYGTSGPA